MRSTLSSTLASTLTIFVTMTSGDPQVIPAAIRGLSECAQNIVFPLLAKSQCNPSNFPCICIELDRLGARDAVAAACTSPELTQFDDFRINRCGNGGRIVNVTTTAVPIIPTGSSNAKNTMIGPFPFNNGTNGTSTGGPIGPVDVSTTAGGGATGTTVNPQFTGAAAAIEPPEFGNARVGLMAGAIGLMGLLFAEL